VAGRGRVGYGRDIALDDPPEEAAISAVTLCGLHHGVLAAKEEHRAGRLAVLAFVERRFAVLPVDARVASHYGRVLPTLVVAANGSPWPTPWSPRRRRLMTSH
jgi:hypothetical protein